MIRLGMRLLPALALILMVGSAAANGLKAKKVDGKPIFEKYKCGSCHAIESEGIVRKAEPGEGEAEGERKPPDLSAVGIERKADWMALFLQKKETIDGRRHIKKFRGTDAELQKLSAWLAGLKDEKAAKRAKAAEKKEASEAKTGK